MISNRSMRWGWAVALLALGACTGNDVRHTLGMERNQPDEFQVVSRPPLSVPPVYYLRPPSEDTPAGISADQRAQSLVFKGDEPAYQAPGASDSNYFKRPETAVVTVGESSLPTSGEEAFMRKAGVNTAQKDIRQVLTQENRPRIVEEKREKGFLDKIRGTGESDEPLVDAEKERERILTNKQEGKPLDQGEVPTVDPKDKSTLERIFE